MCYAGGGRKDDYSVAELGGGPFLEFMDNLTEDRNKCNGRPPPSECHALAKTCAPPPARLVGRSVIVSEGRSPLAGNGVGHLLSTDDLAPPLWFCDVRLGNTIGRQGQAGAVGSPRTRMSKTRFMPATFRFSGPCGPLSARPAISNASRRAAPSSAAKRAGCCAPGLRTIDRTTCATSCSRRPPSPRPGRSGFAATPASPPTMPCPPATQRRRMSRTTSKTSAV